MMKTLLLSCLAALAAFPCAAQEGLRTSERAELLAMFAGPAGLGVVQVARAGSILRTAVPLFPVYLGFAAQLGLSGSDPWGTIERISVPSEGSDIEAPDDLRDALGAMPAMASGAAHLPPFSLFKAEAPAEPVPTAPAGWLVLTRREGSEVRVLKTQEELVRWTSVAELQKRTFDALAKSPAVPK
ncbi:MAG: hypothetical protein HY928_02875 [Elusimicrobia bacterium]|nr:hypothetical protein [Elusimicrobiota bacterium]